MAKNDGGSAIVVEIRDDRAFLGVNSGTSLRVITRDDGGDNTGTIAEFRTQDTPSKFRVGIDGNVGIGEDSPNQALDVNGTIKGKDSSNVASATTTTLPTGNLFHITGTTSITTLNTCDAANNNVGVTLIFDGVLTFTDGNNLILAGDFITTANDTISLVCDGTSWFEKGRSVN